MILPAALLALMLGAGPTSAQSQPEVSVADRGAELRGLDRVSGALTEIEIANGETVAYGGLEITLSECRYPTESPASDAFAHLMIREKGQAQALFDGWMIASSPALMALDHPRYDVWLIRCKTSEGVAGAD